MSSDIFEAQFLNKLVHGTAIYNNKNMVDLGGSFYSYKIKNGTKALKNHLYKIVNIKNNIVFLKEVR